MARLRDRPTPDLVVMFLSAVVGVVLVAVAVEVLVVSLWYPDRDNTAILQRLGAVLSSLVAVIVGYLAGRGVDTGGKPPP